MKIEWKDDACIVYQNGCRIGVVRLNDNPHHMSNSYVTLEMERLDPEISGELFEKLREITGRPLQIMVDSDNVELVDFLLSGGFVCRRKCYEVEAGAEDYIGGDGALRIAHCRPGDAAYEKSCRKLFDHYMATHEAVNPWTADYEAFCEELPEEVICSELDGEVVSLAFVEENEIAYVCGANEDQFTSFACSLVCAMLEKYDTIFFESDDCDWAAMLLRSLFKNQEEMSFDTYIYDNKRTISE